jgi:hypothetical protein
MVPILLLNFTVRANIFTLDYIPNRSSSSQYGLMCAMYEPYDLEERPLQGNCASEHLVDPLPLNMAVCNVCNV